MKYTKPALTFPDQADLLLKRGSGRAHTNRQSIEKFQAVSYYRLSAYWHPFQQPDDTLKPGTTLEMVWRRYTFDRQLRLLVLDAIERVEISVRTQLVCQHSLKHGPFGYLDRANMPAMTVDAHREFLTASATKRAAAPKISSIISSPNTLPKPICQCGWPAN